ncbi:MAG: class I SAM-dependent methyltransferase [archaeon]
MTKYWKEDFVYAWKHFTTPSRPSPSELEYMKQRILEKGKDAKILILGSTPEYRNLCGELGLPVTLIDFNKTSYEVLKGLVDNVPEETLVEDNWISVKLKEKFDIILGDNVVNVMPLPDMKAFIENLSKLLAENGLLFTRNYIRYEGEEYTPEKAIEEYRREGKDWPFQAGTLRNFSLAGYNFDTQMVMLRDIWKGITRIHDKGLITDEEFKEYVNLSLDREGGFCIPLKEESEKWHEEFFKEDDVFYATEPWMKKNLPVFVYTTK